GREVLFLRLCFTHQHAADKDLSESAPIHLLNAVLLGVRRNEGDIGNHLGPGLARILATQLVAPRDDMKDGGGRGPPPEPAPFRRRWFPQGVPNCQPAPIRMPCRRRDKETATTKLVAAPPYGSVPVRLHGF